MKRLFCLVTFVALTTLCGCSGLKPGDFPQNIHTPASKPLPSANALVPTQARRPLAKLSIPYKGQEYDVMLPYSFRDGARNFNPDTDDLPIPLSKLIRIARAQLGEVDPSVTWHLQHLQLVGVSSPEPGTDWFFTLLFHSDEGGSFTLFITPDGKPASIERVERHPLN